MNRMSRSIPTSWPAAVLAMALLAVLHPVPSDASVASGARVDYAPGACPQVVVMSVRGSSETPQGPAASDPSAYADDLHLGMGEFGSLTAGVVQGIANGREVSSAREGVVYPALPIPKTPAQVRAYITSIEEGAVALRRQLLAVLAQETTCGFFPRVQVVGYSQGAWSARIAMQRIAKSEDAWALTYVAGISLYGDPAFRWNESIVRWQQPRRPIFGVGYVSAITMLTPAKWLGQFPEEVRGRTSSYCLPRDLVCRIPENIEDLKVKALATWLYRHAEGHLSYGDDEVVLGGRWLGRHLPASNKPATDRLNLVINLLEDDDFDAARPYFYDDATMQTLHDAIGPGAGAVRGCNVGSAYADCEIIMSTDPSQNWYALMFVDEDLLITQVGLAHERSASAGALSG